MKLFTVFLLAAAFVASSGSPVRAEVRIGQSAPDFKLTDLDGQSRGLSDYKGKVVVLEWNNPDCPIVRKHYNSGNIPGLQKSAMADGVVWLMVNSSAPGREGGDYSADALKAWLQKYGSAPTAYFRDPDGSVGHLYGAKTTPHMFVINTEGILVYDGAIDSIASADPEDIPKATNYVRAALDSLKSGTPIAVSASRPYGCSVKYR